MRFCPTLSGRLGWSEEFLVVSSAHDVGKAAHKLPRLLCTTAHSFWSLLLATAESVPSGLVLQGAASSAPEAAAGLSMAPTKVQR